MNEKEKAKELVDKFRIILINQDTDCGNEILCTLVAKECAKIAVEEILLLITSHGKIHRGNFRLWNTVLKEIELN